MFRIIFGIKLIIDWHNFGYSILALNLGNKSVIVKLNRVYEMLFGRYAHTHFTVTNGMKEELIHNWHIKYLKSDLTFQTNDSLRGPIKVLYDRAPDSFTRLSLTQCHELFSSLQLQSCIKLNSVTEIVKDKIQYKKNRPAILVTSTSFTEDENLNILFDALLLYDDNNHTALPHLLVYITGKGPMKSFYQEKLQLITFKRVRVEMIWLAIEDYPKLLGNIIDRDI